MSPFSLSLPSPTTFPFLQTGRRKKKEEVVLLHGQQKQKLHGTLAAGTYIAWFLYYLPHTSMTHTPQPHTPTHRLTCLFAATVGASETHLLSLWIPQPCMPPSLYLSLTPCMLPCNMSLSAMAAAFFSLSIPLPHTAPPYPIS